MNHSSPSDVITRRLPLWVYLLPGAIAAVLVAVFVFNMPLRTVGTWAAFIAFFGMHFFMHGRHGAPGSRGQHSAPAGPAAPVNAPAAIDGPPDMETHDHESGHGCC